MLANAVPRLKMDDTGAAADADAAAAIAAAAADFPPLVPPVAAGGDEVAGGDGIVGELQGRLSSRFKSQSWQPRPLDLSTAL